MFVKKNGRRVQKQNKKSACIFETQLGPRADGYGGTVQVAVGRVRTHDQVAQHWFLMARTGTPTKGHERERIQTQLCAQELRDEAARAAGNDVF